MRMMDVDAQLTTAKNAALDLDHKRSQTTEYVYSTASVAPVPWSSRIAPGSVLRDLTPTTEPGKTAKKTEMTRMQFRPREQSYMHK